jgi:hypothetical protein
VVLSGDEITFVPFWAKEQKDNIRNRNKSATCNFILLR